MLSGLFLTKGVAEANQSGKRAGGGWGRVSRQLWEACPGNAVEWPSPGTCHHQELQENGLR